MNLRAMAGAFLLGIVVAAVPLLVTLFPARVYGAWCQLRHGAEPSGKGLILTIRPAPPSVAGPGRGPWVVLELKNIARHPRMLHTFDELGDELVLSGELAGRALERVAPGPADANVSRPARLHQLSSGGRLGFVCDLSRWLKLPATGGTLTVRATRISPRERCSSNPIVLDLRP